MQHVRSKNEVYSKLCIMFIQTMQVCRLDCCHLCCLWVEVKQWSQTSIKRQQCKGNEDIYDGKFPQPPWQMRKGDFSHLIFLVWDNKALIYRQDTPLSLTGMKLIHRCGLVDLRFEVPELDPILNTEFPH